MTDDTSDTSEHHHSLRERIDAAEAAAAEVVAEESGQLGGEVSALALPFEEAAAAVRAAIHPHTLAEHETRSTPAANGVETEDADAPAAERRPGAPAGD